MHIYVYIHTGTDPHKPDKYTNLGRGGGGMKGRRNAKLPAEFLAEKILDMSYMSEWETTQG
jgi:hypothetical protein